MNLKRTKQHETLYEFLKNSPEKITSLIPAGHEIGEPAPIFRMITDDEMNKWKEQFGGENAGGGGAGSAPSKGKGKGKGKGQEKVEKKGDDGIMKAIPSILQGIL